MPHYTLVVKHSGQEWGIAEVEGNMYGIVHFHKKAGSRFVLRSSKGELRCRKCGEFLPDNFKAIAVIYGLSVEIDLTYNALGFKPYGDLDETTTSSDS